MSESGSNQERYLLRLEAVNFAWSCYDTQDISTIRGGSLLLMNAPSLLHTDLDKIGPLTLVTEGASQAIYRFEAEATEADAIRDRMEQHLVQHSQLKHATFVVDVVREGENALLELRARNRWRQFRQPTLAVPDGNVSETNEAKLPKTGRRCEVDFVRPAVRSSWKGDERQWVSESVDVRRKYGRTHKQKFYRDGIPDLSKVLEFTYDLRQLSSRQAANDPVGHLHEKIAVIYLDGNKQAETASEYDLDQLEEFRTYLRECQRAFLEDLLDDVRQVPPPTAEQLRLEDLDWYWRGESGEGDAKKVQTLVRLETLLWGGDDIVLVVPAWQGWRTVRLFFEHVTGSREKIKPWEFDGHRLTYAAGVVFCRCSSPIQRMRDLAEELLVLCKKASGAEERYDNWLAYEVLESFDVGGADLERWRGHRLELSESESSDRLLLSAKQLADLERLVTQVRESVEGGTSEHSRRRIESLARSMNSHPPHTEAFDTKIDSLFEEISQVVADLPIQDDRRATLFHLSSLWDYLYELNSPVTPKEQ